MKKQMQAMLEKEMNRKEFLGYIGAVVLAVIGVSGMIKALLHHSNSVSIPNHSVASGYGSTSYGGNEAKRSFFP